MRDASQTGSDDDLNQRTVCAQSRAVHLSDGLREYCPGFQLFDGRKI
ncbi:hypothetical protein JM93_01546 [Roseibium hamelinense]|uniref:Uncharacterized protein n=1 Tax=Roseibium hamelinense TaxID=150831 RepID=A0A562TA99_9HYPH|nr:hypothetical protein JM93_01546 [Roseibium hamelinense]